MKHTLEADSVRLQYNGRKVLSDVYLKCETGKVTGLLGRNGQGKSSLMKAIFGSVDAEKSVRFDNRVRRKPYEDPRLIRYLPQFNFIPKFLRLRKVFLDYDADWSLFERTFPNFSGRGNERIGNLSGGENRFVELFVLITSTAQFALLDEPFTHLSPLQTEAMKALIIAEKVNKGFLVTDHMFQHVTEVADDLYLLVDGKTRRVTNPEDLGNTRLYVKRFEQ